MEKSQLEQQQLAQLLREYSNVFSKDENDLGYTSLMEHAIETGDAKPIKQAPRRPPLALAGEEKKAIDQMLK